MSYVILWEVEKYFLLFQFTHQWQVDQKLIYYNSLECKLSVEGSLGLTNYHAIEKKKSHHMVYLVAVL